MISVGTNIGAMNAYAAIERAQTVVDRSIERMSTGKRINAARDDAAGISIASRLDSKIRGINQAITNITLAESMVASVDGGLTEITERLQRIREIAIQGANDTNSNIDRTSLNHEIETVLSDVDSIAGSTNWAGRNMLSNNNEGAAGGIAPASDIISFTVGPDMELINFETRAATSMDLGLRDLVLTSVISSTDPQSSANLIVATTSSGLEIKPSGTINAGDTFKILIADDIFEYTATDDDANSPNPAAAVISALIDAISSVRPDVLMAAPATLQLEGLDSPIIQITSTVGSAGSESEQIISLPKNLAAAGPIQNVFPTTPNDPDVVALKNGNFVVVNGSQGQLYSASGAKIGQQFSFIGTGANVEALSGGGFVIGTSSGNVYIYDENCNLQSASSTTFTVSGPIEISVHSNDQILIIARGNQGMSAQLFDSNGSRASGAFKIPGTENLTSSSPFDWGAAPVGSDKFFVSWVDGYQLKSVIIATTQMPVQPPAVAINQFYALNEPLSARIILQQPFGYDIESIDVVSAGDGTVWVAYGIEQVGLAGNVDATRYDEFFGVLQKSSFGPVSREYITLTHTFGGDLLYFEDTAVRREIKLTAPNSSQLASLQRSRNTIYVRHGETNNAVASNGEYILLLTESGGLSREMYKPAFPM